MLEGRPLKGYELERLKEFLKSMDLDYDTGIEYSICLEDEDYRIIAAGSVEENVLKCIAISPDHQGEGLSGTIISHLTQSGGCLKRRKSHWCDRSKLQSIYTGTPLSYRNCFKTV